MLPAGERIFFKKLLESAKVKVSLNVRSSCHNLSFKLVVLLSMDQIACVFACALSKIEKVALQKNQIFIILKRSK